MKKNGRRKRALLRLLPALAVGAIATLVVAYGDEQGASERPGSSPEPAASPSRLVPDAATGPAAGRKVTIDPATGRVRRGPAVARDLDDGLRFSGAGLVERRLPPEIGGAMVDLQGRFMASTRVTIEADGSVRVECTAVNHQGHDHPPAATEEAAR